jgi:MYXO-CTERM domain-containing protein
MLGPFLLFALAAGAPGLTAPIPTQEIYGGTVVVSCGWPTTVSMEGGCTGTLVHPQVVIYAAHCGTGYGTVTFGEDIEGTPGRHVPTQFCRTYPGGGPGGGNDWALCVLAEPQLDVPIVPILMGCETSVLTVGREVTIVGFGDADTGPYGIKREVTTTVGGFDGNEIFIGGGGADGTWRVFGITSYGGQCGQGGYYSMMHVGIDWFETESGFDLTPCHDTAGTWIPSPDCGGFPLQPNDPGGSWSDGCDTGPTGGLSAICGAPFGASSDTDPPTVELATPEDGGIFDSDPASGVASIPVEAIADDGMGYGVEVVELLINGQAVPMGEDYDEPYTWVGSYPPGQYSFQVIATDVSGNVAESEIVYVGVDMEPATPPDPGDGTGGSDESGGTGIGGTAGADDGVDDAGTAADVDGSAGASEGDPKGCGCRGADRTGPWWMLGLLGLMIARRRRG